MRFPTNFFVVILGEFVPKWFALLIAVRRALQGKTVPAISDRGVRRLLRLFIAPLWELNNDWP